MEVLCITPGIYTLLVLQRTEADFLPVPGQKLLGNFAQRNKHKLGACWAAKANPNLVAASWRQNWAPDWPA